jgi:hypothetical protein
MYPRVSRGSEMFPPETDSSSRRNTHLSVPIRLAPLLPLLSLPEQTRVHYPESYFFSVLVARERAGRPSVPGTSPRHPPARMLNWRNMFGPTNPAILAFRNQHQTQTASGKRSSPSLLTSPYPSPSHLIPTLNFEKSDNCFPYLKRGKAREIDQEQNVL